MALHFLTVFTPTYNRKHLLPRLYDSLRNQSFKHFTWLIIDDGSTDGTTELVEIWQQQKILDIKYIYKKNEGMHSAHNVAFEKIATPWCTCIDSDDLMPRDAVELILNEIKNVNDEMIYGLVGLDADFSFNILGSSFPDDVQKVKMHELQNRYGITGDKKQVYKTEILRKLPPYPIFEGEKLVPLSYKTLLAERNFYLKPLNKVLCLVEYQEDGSTRNMLKQYRRNPKGFSFMRREILNANVPLKEKLKSAVHLVSSSLFTLDLKNLFRTQHLLLILVAIPAGILLNIYIRIRNTVV